MEQPKMIFQKNTSKSKNQLVIPKRCIAKWGCQYYLEVYDNYIKLVPVKKEN